MNHTFRWTPQKIAQRLALIEPQIYRRRQPLPPFRYVALDDARSEPPVGVEVDHSAWEEIAPHSYWGDWMTTFVMRTTFAVPPEWSSAGPVALYLPLNQSGDFSHPEALAYVDGEAYATCDRHHQEILLPPAWRDGQPHLLALHGWTGLEGWFRGELETRLFMHPCAVVQIDQSTREFVATARVALGIADQLDANEPARGRLYQALDDAFRQLDTRDLLGEAFYDSVPAAHDALRSGIARAGEPLDVEIVAAGHAHLDIAWLWPVAQARHKARRTFHTVMRLMEQFPTYQFSQSQPQLYDMIRQDQPDLLSVIKERVAEGRWEPLGGMWVEADCTLSGGEALARQFLLGRTFFREQFGPDAESPVLWLPDVFGYAWNLPQLIKEAGLDYFFTIKISWNQYNRMPYDSFWWQGLDGTKVLTHFSSTQDAGSFAGEPPRPTTYNGAATPLEMLSTWQNSLHKENQRVFLTAFGYGDGGGGPTRTMLENIREMAAFPATPQVRHGKVIDFFRQLETESGDSLPIWNGELYLELHRGTYTSQAQAKRNNRQSEFLLHDAEFLAAWAALHTDFDYPHAELTRAWQLLCLNQFHDILPGSSVPDVYVDSAADYAVIRAIGEQVRDEAATALSHRMAHPEVHSVAINPTSFEVSPIILVPNAAVAWQPVDLAGGRSLATQPVRGGTLVALPSLAPYSLTAIGEGEGEPAPAPGAVAATSDGDTAVLENDQVRAVFASSGDLVSLWDKQAGRQVLAEGERGNVFQAFEDRPMFWDAWDIDIYYDDRQWEANPASRITIIEDGPLRAGLEIERTLGASTIVQRVYLLADSRSLTFDTQINWQEQHTLLKVAFPVDLLSPVATYDVQWGNVERPTHRNTTWDWARFESYAHKWVDLSEGDYGVSLLNDGKYGHDIHGHVIRLTLLRSPTYPDPNTDQGDHRFTYALYLHQGDWRSGTAAAAYALNDPVWLHPVGEGSGDGAAASLLEVDAPNVIIETIKQAEDGEGVIVRLYENERSRGVVTVRTAFPLAAVHRCNLLEENQAELRAESHSVSLTIKPYQIVTLRLTPDLAGETSS